MANSTSTMITSMAMLILFTFAIIGFSLGFANDNDTAVRIDSDDDLDSLYSSSNGVVDNLRENAGETYSSIINTTIAPGSDVIKSPGAFTLTWGNLYSTFGTIISVINTKIFGGNKNFMIFTTSLVTLLGILFTLYLIKAWRGSP